MHAFRIELVIVSPVFIFGSFFFLLECSIYAVIARIPATTAPPANTHHMHVDGGVQHIQSLTFTHVQSDF